MALKVLHVIPAVAARYGGPSEAVLKMCRALDDAGVEISLVTTDADGEGRLPVRTDEWIDYAGVRARFFPRQCSEAFKYSRPLARWLNRYTSDFDIVHIHAVFSHSSLAAATAARRAGVPYLVRPLGSLSPWGLTQKRRRKHVLWRMGVGKILRHAAAIHCTSRREKQHADAAIGRALGVVIPLGVDPPVLEAGETQLSSSVLGPKIDGHPYVLTLGRLHPVKGLDLLLTAFLDLVKQERFSHWRLVIAGDGQAEYVQILKRLVREWSGESHVLFSGWLSGPGKAAALRNASLLAMPSHQENFGLAAFEALAHGVPVLASAQIDVAEEIGAAQAGWISALDPQELKSTLAEALIDDPARARRGTAARALVANQFAWPTVAERLNSLYRQFRCGHSKEMI